MPGEVNSTLGTAGKDSPRWPLISDAREAFLPLRHLVVYIGWVGITIVTWYLLVVTDWVGVSFLFSVRIQCIGNFDILSCFLKNNFVPKILVTLT